jgi:hypothetical protein
MSYNIGTPEMTESPGPVIRQTFENKFCFDV